MAYEGPQCPGCKLGTFECECCPSCHAAPDQACDEHCGLESEGLSITDELYDLWRDNSDLFEPLFMGMDSGVE